MFFTHIVISPQMLARYLNNDKKTETQIRETQVTKSDRQGTTYAAKQGQVSNQILVTCLTDNTVRQLCPEESLAWSGITKCRSGSGRRTRQLRGGL